MADKLAAHRLSVLELAQELGNVTEACLRRGLDRASFYEWSRRFQTHGFAGLKDLPPIHKSHPQATPPETVERIKELAVEHPAYGCNRLEPMLSWEGRRVSSITIQKILNDNGLGTRQDRWLALEKANADKALELTAEEAWFPEKLNPCFRERQASCCQPTPSLSAPSREWARCTCTRWWTPTAPTPSGSCTSRSSPRLRWRCCTNDVLPFYRRPKLEVKAVYTDNGRELCGTERHPDELNLDLNGIAHRRTKVRTPWTNGFVERFKGTVLKEFFRVTMPEKFYDSVDTLQQDLDAWLRHYHTERPHLGYQNQGRRPIETINQFVRPEV